jgi:hypothetical protein
MRRNWITMAAVVSVLAGMALGQAKIPEVKTAELVDVPAASRTTYPDKAGFEQRAQRVIAALATNDLSTWRKGYFSGGDQGKYLPGASMAKLMLNPDDADVRKYMNDERSYKEHYHFAAVNWARFYPLFGEQVITPETKQKLVGEAQKYSAYLNPSGTENHKTMNMMAASVVPTYWDTGLARKSKTDTLAAAKKELQTFIKTTYATGNGEWDSSTYWQFTVNGLLNIYDFAEDPETRLIARAGLDWFLANYAIKYRDGFFMAPNQRGFPEKPLGTIADQSGYIWWGSNYEPTDEQMKRYLYTLHAITSSYRPSETIYNIAKKNLPGLPAVQQNTKANYWYGQGIYAQANGYAETLYIAPKYSMASMWNGHGSQITRFQIVADSPAGGMMFTGGHPRRSDHTGKMIEFGYKDGIGRFDQSAQVQGTWFNLTQAPDSEPIDYSFFAYPEGVTPKPHGEWMIMQAGDTFVAVRAFGEKAVLGETDLSDKQKDENQKAIDGGKEPKHKAAAIIKIPGRKNGMIVESADTTMYDSLDAFAAALAKTELKADGLSIAYKTLRGEAVTFAPGEADRAQVTVNGEAVDVKKWDAVYSGPFVNCKDGVLSVFDGKTGYQVDFTGDLPVYRPLPK